MYSLATIHLNLCCFLLQNISLIMAEQDPWAPFAEKYTIHEEAREYTRLAAASGIKPYSEVDVETARQMVITRAAVMAGEVDFDGEETEIIVPSPHVPEGIPVSVYKPSSCPSVPAIWVYFHGGGLVLCNRKTHETVAKILARDSGAIIVSVEFRLLPNPSAPYAPFDDGEVVTRWVLENKEAVGGKPTSKVGVGGDSAGGQIAVGITNDVTDLDFQILIYPFTDTSMSNDTFREFRMIPGLGEDSLKFFFENALYPMPDYLTNPRVNGMARTNTELSPPALIILAELDPLRGCGLDYAEKLRAAGVKVQCEIIKGVPHAFFSLTKVFKTKSVEAHGHVVKFLQQFQ